MIISVLPSPDSPPTVVCFLGICVRSVSIMVILMNQRCLLVDLLFSSLIKLRFVLNGPGNDLMALACLLVGWTNPALISITIALVVTTSNTNLLPLDLGHKLQKHTWRRFENFTDSSRGSLLKDALFALRETLQGEKLTSTNCTVAVVGVGEAFHMLDKETIQGLINEFELAGEEDPAATTDAAADIEPAVPEAGALTDKGAAPMDL